MVFHSRQRHALSAVLLLVLWHNACAFTTVSRTATLGGRANGLNIRDHRLLVSNKETQPTSSGDVNGSPNGETPPKVTTSPQHFFTYVARKAIQIYSDYASRLWRETSSDARKKVASDRITQSIRQVQHVFRGEKYCDFSKVSSKDRQNLLDACDSILADNEKRNGDSDSDTTANAKAIVADTSSGEKTSDDKNAVETSTDSTGAAVAAPKKKAGRSVLFGATMGAAAAGWVFSGNYVFTGFFTLMTILGQLEYYRMVMNTGVYPARRISIIGAASMFLTVSTVQSCSEHISCPVICSAFDSMQHASHLCDPAKYILST